MTSAIDLALQIRGFDYMIVAYYILQAKLDPIS